MAKIFNENNIEFKRKGAPLDEYNWRTSQNLTQEAGAGQMGFDMRSLDPGKYSYPYHYHLSAEELMVVMKGKMMMRTPEGFCEVKQGDTIFFETGETGAHQFFNHTKEPCRYLDVRIAVDMDICEYPDTGKLNIINRGIFYKGDEAGYFDGEEHVAQKWEEAVRPE